MTLQSPVIFAHFGHGQKSIAQLSITKLKIPLIKLQDKGRASIRHAFL